NKAMQLHDSIVNGKLRDLRKSADSLNKAMKRLKDSLNYEGGGNLGELFRNLDPRGLFSDSMLKNWKFDPKEIPEGKFFERFKNILPRKNKKQKVVPNFEGWRYEGLGEV